MNWKRDYIAIGYSIVTGFCVLIGFLTCLVIAIGVIGYLAKGEIVREPLCGSCKKGFNK